MSRLQESCPSGLRDGMSLKYASPLGDGEALTVAKILMLKH